MTPNGIRNQPDRPKLVICSNAFRNHGGSRLAQPLAAASRKNIAATAAVSVATAAATAGSGGRSARVGGTGATARLQRARFCHALRANSSTVRGPGGVSVAFAAVVLSDRAFSAFTARLPIGTPRW